MLYYPQSHHGGLLLKGTSCRLTQVRTQHSTIHASMKETLLEALEHPPKQVRAVLNRSSRSFEIPEILPLIVKGNVSTLAVIIDWPENEYVWMDGDVTTIATDEKGEGFDFNPTALRLGHFQRGNEAVLTISEPRNWLPFWPGEDPTYQDVRRVLARMLRTNSFGRG